MLAISSSPHLDHAERSCCSGGEVRKRSKRPASANIPSTLWVFPGSATKGVRANIAIHIM